MIKRGLDMKGLVRYLVHCEKCHYEWLSYKKNPTRCALCNNPNISEPKKRERNKEASNNEHKSQ